MRRQTIYSALFVCVAVVLDFVGCGSEPQVILKIGINAPLTGAIAQVGEATQSAARMWLKEINDAGGIQVGEKRYRVKLVIQDNASQSEAAVMAATRLIVENEVLAIVGPQSSKQAVPTGAVCNDLATPMISPWSTNPYTTRERPFVFRTCFLDPFQGPAVARFVMQEYGFTKAAVLFARTSDYPRSLAGFFKTAWENLNGAGSVVAYEGFSAENPDFGAQLNKIIESGAEFLFVPQYYSEVPGIVRQAHALGWNKPIIGSDSWDSAETAKLCGKDCRGLFFSTHYAAAGARGETRAFIDRFEKRYGYVPDAVAALTWDAMCIVQKAIERTGGLTGDIKKDRRAVRDALAGIQDFNGITGKMTFTKGGDPHKCVVIVRINDAGEFEFYKTVCPDTKHQTQNTKPMMNSTFCEFINIEKRESV